jgi:integrase
VSPGAFAEIARHLPEPLDDLARYAYTVGWRVGEAKTLEWRDVDLASRRVTLRRQDSKNKQPRVIVLTGELIELMEHRWAARSMRPADAKVLSGVVNRVSGGVLWWLGVALSLSVIALLLWLFGE